MVSRASEEEGEAPASGKRNRGRSCRNDRGAGRAEARSRQVWNKVGICDGKQMVSV